eukprot:Opistho-1_new@51227
MSDSSAGSWQCSTSHSPPAESPPGRSVRWRQRVAVPSSTVVRRTTRRDDEAEARDAAPPPNAASKRRRTHARSSSVRMRWRYSTSQTCDGFHVPSACDATMASHHRDTSRRLNSHGAPLRPKDPLTIVSSCRRALKETMRARRGRGIEGYMVVAIHSRSASVRASTYTCVKRLRKDFGSPFRPPPCCVGFWHANTRNDAPHSNVLSSSGMYTVPLWSRHALRPSRTLCWARLSSSKSTHTPARIARRNGPSRHANSPPLPPSTGRSEPKRSMTSVWSLRLMRTMGYPAAAASAVTRLVLPTPGEPSRRMGRRSCMPRRTRCRLRHVVGACSAKRGSLGCVPLGRRKGCTPKASSVDTIESTCGCACAPE